MGKMIDADALIAKCGDWYTEEGTEEGFIGTVKQLLELQPEAVVRCKDCIYWDTQDRSTGGIAKCNYQSVARYLAYTDADDFCSHGESKTDE